MIRALLPDRVLVPVRTLFGGALCALALSAAVLAQDPPKPEPLAPVRYSGIPGPDKQKLTKEYEAVTAALLAELNRPVVYVWLPDYASAVTALAADKVDVVFVDGLSAVQAEELTSNKVRPMFARTEDVKLTSFFIANKALVDSGKLEAVQSYEPRPITQLAALRPVFKECTFTFGPKLSTSSSILPRRFLELPEVGLEAERDFKAAPGYQASAAATLSSVGSGAFDVGVVDSASWKRASDAEKAAAPVIYVTPAYKDECVLIHPRLGPVLPLRVMSFFVKLDPKKPADKAVLDVYRTQQFVPVNPKEWDGIREVYKSSKARGILQQ